MDLLDDLLDYDVRFDSSASLIASKEPDEYVLEIHAELVFKPEQGPKQVVGQLNAQVLQLSRAIDDQYPVRDVLDATQELADLYKACFNKRTAEFRESLQNEFEILSSDILFLETVEVDSTHQGRGLGLALVSRCIELCAPAQGLVACKPFPLQFSSSRENRPDWHQRVGTSAFVTDQRLATKKLASYWGLLGFRKIRNSAYAVLSTTLRRPSLESILENLRRP